MPPRLVFFLAYQLLAYSSLLNFGLSSPIQNVEVVPLANNGETTSAIVLPTGALNNKNKSTLGTGTDGKPVSLIEKGEKNSDNKALSLDSSTSTSRLVNAEKVTSTSLTQQTNVNGTQDQIAKLLERPSNGKSFFADQTTTTPTPKPEGNQEEKKKTNPAGLVGELKPPVENTGQFPAVKLLSEKPLVTSPSADQETITAEGKASVEPKAELLAPKLSSPPVDLKPVELKPPKESKQKQVVPAKKDGGEASKKPETAEINKEQLRKDPKGSAPKPNEINLIGKDIKPLLEKPTSTVDPTDENAEGPVLLSLGRITDEEPNETESKTGRGAKKADAEKNAGSRNDPQEASKIQSGGAHGKNPEDKPQKSLPTVDSAKDLGPEPAPKAPPPTAPKATTPSPPPPGKSAPGPESPDSKEKFPEAQHMRMAGNTANTLSVVQGGSNSTAAKESEGPPEEKSQSKLLIYIGAGVVGFLVLLVSFILFAKKKQKKEKKIPGGVQSEIPVEFGSGEGASQITTPLSPPMSLNGKSERGIPVALPTPRGDQDLVGGKSFSRQLRGSTGYERNYSTGYGSEYGRDQYAQDAGSAYDESEFYDNSRYRGGRDQENRGRVDSFPSRRSSGRASPRSEKGRFPYNRRSAHFSFSPMK
ncbi:hypothetical protein PtA15_1A914 [Puccinia triticina]|uniref:Uncharacterized protein n=1 Tax=Puccinia triticina TaxID=208348 RepID=A0ABY7CCC8_9BASI|nr:uncharacterized protein PtA15_1A914 [Puccinia triticina]WAQ81572.1 hypothetical protein PtA15_1A914 [Puccinia triticina]